MGKANGMQGLPGQQEYNTETTEKDDNLTQTNLVTNTETEGNLYTVGEIPAERKRHTSGRACIAVLCILAILAAVGAAVLFLVVLPEECSLRYQYTDHTSQLEYKLSYCGVKGDYCETIMDPTNDQSLENCDEDPDYVDSTYVGNYNYLQAYADSIKVDVVVPQPDQGGDNNGEENNND